MRTPPRIALPPLNSVSPTSQRHDLDSLATGVDRRLADPAKQWAFRTCARRDGDCFGTQCQQPRRRLRQSGVVDRNGACRGCPPKAGEKYQQRAVPPAKLPRVKRNPPVTGRLPRGIENLLNRTRFNANIDRYGPVASKRDNHAVSIGVRLPRAEQLRLLDGTRTRFIVHRAT
jgi:hypothetical protein